MATKRSHEESEDIHPSRQDLVHGNEKESKPAKKPRPSEPPTMRKQAHASSVNAIKKRLRDVTRRLQRSQDLPATVRADDERALAAYQQELAAADEEKVRQKMIKKYHMVRFFERKRATRMQKKLKKRLLESVNPDEVEAIKARMDVIEIDLNYTQYYPLNERYVSLYPPKGSEEEAADEGEAEKDLKDVIATKPPMWKEIEKCMSDGTLKELRHGVRNPTLAPAKPKFQKSVALPAKTAPEKRPIISQQRNVLEKKAVYEKPAPVPYVAGENRRARRKAMGLSRQGQGEFRQQPVRETPKEEAREDGNISDGGFFEE